ncbi:Gamma-glutamylputrescine oxidoreductase [Thalassovita gelatinovora]|uniref:Gamma-glutamylputrescine oxidoreductase n=1 Tax=Thalassovita gelatinovora TaxID=53501 RepID=A0A0P1F9X2_THAGE|nr:FAD-binding oxidoreductase [Thalassovita gelatinovora]QIZ81132.1 FAD-binding oxidoreductase [Thalassovita gelatinovora]CUH64849.1 Gamma-glutamylputrescine oxidoreductase [Thalassovita gelatinovora]SEP90967.1 Glycine/D-amino acid oxidase [Thalassovita gelatinovora]
MPVDFPNSLWANTAPERTPSAPLSGTEETDVAVIGAGFTGLSAAIEVRRRGHAVTLLEGKAAGWGASGRNNGQVIPILTSAEPDTWVSRYGDAGKRMVHLIGNSGDVLFDLVREFDMQAEAEQTGWFQPVHSPGRIKLAQKRVEAWQRFGFPAELKTPEECATILGTDFWHGGMLNPTGGHINPLALAREMARIAEHLGAVIHEESPAMSFERIGHEWVITTPKGKLKARALILASNAYTGELAPRLAPRIARSVVPVLSWQMATEPVGDNLSQKILPGRQAVSDTRGDLRFFRYDARNRLITGGAVIGSFDVANRVRKKAAQRLGEAFPDLGVPEMTHVWSGYIGMNWDRFPRVHKLGPDAWAWIGCNGRGVALGTSLGRELARAVTGQPEDELALPVTDPTPFPMHGIVRRVAPTYLAWLKRQDHKEINL